MVIEIFVAVIQALTALIMLISVVLLSLSISNNSLINQRNLFNGIVKQERELRIKLNDYVLF